MQDLFDAFWRRYYFDQFPAYGEAEVVTDKLPINFQSIALFRTLFPESQFLFLERDPLDVCVSIFRHQFPRAYAWSHRLDDIGHFYRLHEDLKAFYAEACADRVSIVRHKDFLADPEAAIRALLEKAGLDWEETCLDHQAKDRAIATFSSVEVRMPISQKATSSAGLFDPYLEELKAALDG